MRSRIRFAAGEDYVDIDVDQNPEENLRDVCEIEIPH